MSACHVIRVLKACGALFRLQCNLFPALLPSLRLQVWDMSGYTGGVLSQAAAAFVIREVAVWRGHKAHVTSLDWMLPGSSPLASGLGLAPGIAVGPPGAPGSSGGTGLDERGSLSSANISMSGAASGAAGGGAFLLSSSADCTVVLWSATGGRVGTFGQSMWSLTVGRQGKGVCNRLFACDQAQGCMS